MGIKIIAEADIVLDFVLRLNSNPEKSCKMIPTDREELKAYIEKIIAHENDFIAGVYGITELKGVFFLFYEPKDKYFELIAGYAEEDAVYKEFFTFMKKTYSGYTLDMVLNPCNKALIESARIEGAEFDGEQAEMILTDFCPEVVLFQVVSFSDKYADKYKAMHIDDGSYWTAEKIIAAKSIFRSYIAICDENPIGYIDVTYNNPKNEIYNLFVLAEYRGLGYESALIQEAILNNNGKEMIFLVNTDDDYIMKLCVRLGFMEGEHSIYAKLEL